MTRLMFKPVHMGQLKEMLDKRVWYFDQAPNSFRLIAVLGTWVAGWAEFRVLTAFSPFAETSGGDLIPIILVGWFGGIAVSGIAIGIVAMIVSRLVLLATGKSLYFSVSAPDGLKRLDPVSDVVVTLPIAIGLFAGFACWFFGLDPSLGLAPAIGLG
jgi:hypothetical protein